MSRFRPDVIGLTEPEWRGAPAPLLVSAVRFCPTADGTSRLLLFVAPGQRHSTAFWAILDIGPVLLVYFRRLGDVAGRPVYEGVEWRGLGALNPHPDAPLMILASPRSDAAAGPHDPTATLLAEAIGS